MKDAEQVEKSLKIMQAHAADGPDALESELVTTDHEDLAAQSLIARLLDPEQREEALRDVQKFAPIPESDWEKSFDVKWDALIARQDVQAAINKVGRAETFRLELFD
jgi:beta-barrel assembly-enhancing protease